MINILLSVKDALLEPQNKEIFSKYITSEDTVCLVNLSFFSKYLPTKEDYEQYYSEECEKSYETAGVYASYGVNKFNVINYYQDSKKEALKKIRNSTILHLPGGAPDEFFLRLKEFNLLDKALYNTKVIIGSSAGSMVQLSTYQITPDQDYHDYSINNG
ncbi:MAG: Type 1 glutamine amidotransferase-like domain-containing protein, partial [Acholeplasmatales bacterium]|nr:Type 1 glutamine amidotransferase-like domain-containing protein [Acholeplasmatales bacterium]